MSETASPTPAGDADTPASALPPQCPPQPIFRDTAQAAPPPVAPALQQAPLPYPPPASYPPPYGYLPLTAPRAGTNGFSIAAMVLGIVWVWWIGSILALVFGYIAKSQIDRSEGTQNGRGMAIAGIVLGWIGVGILAVILV